jgi:tetratricopeptide (TPR) repeat protein
MVILKKALLFSICVSIIATASAQKKMASYFYLINKADSLTKTKNLVEAENSYLKALRISDGDPEVSLSAASLSLRLQQVKKAESQIRKATRNGADQGMIAADSILFSYVNQNKQLQKDIAEMRGIYLSDIKNEDERTTLLSMVATDQTLRSLLGTLDLKKVDSLIHINDTRNMAGLKAIIAKIGFPDREKVGKDGADAAFILMMHTFNDGSNDERDIMEIEPLMKSAVLAGKFSPYYLAILTDRNRGLKRQKQVYGTYWEKDRKSGKRIISVIEDIPNVDRRREKLGLPSLGYVAEQQRLIVPEGYNIH